MAKPTQKQIRYATALLRRRGQEDLPVEDYSKKEMIELISSLLEDGYGTP